MAATTNESTTAGPAWSAAAIPVSENRPAPMIAPMPRATRLTGPRVFFKWCSPLSDSALIRSSDFVANRLIYFAFQGKFTRQQRRKDSTVRPPSDQHDQQTAR